MRKLRVGAILHEIRLLLFSTGKSKIRRLLPILFNALLVILFFTTPFLWRHYKWSSTDGILAYTCWAILLYTWKTWQLKDLTSKQLSYNVRPLVVLSIKKNISYITHKADLKVINGEPCIEIAAWAELKNIGEGIATNIEIEPIKVEKDTSIFTSGISALGKNSEEAVRFYVLPPLNNPEITEQLIGGATEDNTIKIYYNDFSGRRFQTLMQYKELGGAWHFIETGEACK